MNRSIGIMIVTLQALLMTPSVQGESFCICQRDIPLTIKRSGEYRLCENITFNSPGTAITVTADNVTLKLGSHSITLTDGSATAILIDGSTEFKIESDAIKNVFIGNQTGYGIHVIGARKGLIKNVLTINHLNGLFIENSQDICIKDSEFSNASGAGVFVTDSEALLFEKCIFSQNSNGLKMSGANKDCTLISSKFPSSTFSNLLVQQINGMIIEDCLFTHNIGDATKANLMQFGDAALEQTCNDVVIKNCTLISRPGLGGSTSPEGLGIYQGSGFLVESCIIDIDNTNQDPTVDLSGIHISNPGLGSTGTIATDVIVRNCVIQGPATNGLYPDVGTSGVVIEDCIASGAQKNGIFLAGTTGSIVKNNTVVNNGTNGIFLGETSISNAVTDNMVSMNGSNPIVSSLPPLGNGISIASDSSLNTVQYNKVFNNAQNGIDDQGTGNQIYFNTAYVNGNKNYNAASDVIVISNPGNPAKSAENISA